MNASRPLLLEVRDLCKRYPMSPRGGADAWVRAVDGVSFDVYEGECLGLVGESGSGKTTVGKVILRATDPDAGSVLLHHGGSTVELATASRDALKTIRRQMQMIFQDPFSSLNPRMNVFEIVGEPLLIHGMTNRREREAHVRMLLRQVGLSENHLCRFPHAFSGGQRQRIGIARALALKPRLIVADEAVSALDVSVQAQVLNLLSHLQDELGLTYLFIAHDLGVVRHIADRIAVMYSGQLVEVARVDDIFARPRHPYTEALLSAIPVDNPSKRKAPRIVLAGEAARSLDAARGCPFNARCRYAQDRCRNEAAYLTEVGPGRAARCHFAGELELSGALV